MKKLRLHCLILISSLWLSACGRQEKQEKNVINTLPAVKKEYHFDLKGDADRYRGKIYYDKTKKQEFVYFTDTETDKIIKVFDLKGSLIQEIPLNFALKHLEVIQNFHIVSLDTIILTSKGSNRLVIINRKGQVWENKNLTSLFTDEKSNNYKMWLSYPLDDTGNSFVARLEWLSNQKDIAQNKDPKEGFEQMRYQTRYVNTSNSFCKLSNIYGSNPSVKFGIDSFYAKLGNPQGLYAELPLYSVTNKKLFQRSMYTDTLYQINPNTFDIEKKIIIVSEKTPVGKVKPYKMDSLSLLKTLSSNLVSITFGTAGFTAYVAYDYSTKLYLVIVSHQISINTPDAENGNAKRPHSILVYDKDFKKLKEIVFDNQTHHPDPIESKEGVLFMRKSPSFSPKDKTKAHEKVTLTLFDFNK